jgi:hypothetical protein
MEARVDIAALAVKVAASTTAMGVGVCVAGSKGDVQEPSKMTIKKSVASRKKFTFGPPQGLCKSLPVLTSVKTNIFQAVPPS